MKRIKLGSSVEKYLTVYPFTQPTSATFCFGLGGSFGGHSEGHLEVIRYICRSFDVLWENLNREIVASPASCTY